MSGERLVSVIIIFLNAEQFIREAIESVFAQTYGVWELLLVDDGSVDGSTAIAQVYSELYPGRVRYLEHAGHQNRGKSASRHLGTQYAIGEYIAYLDADDVWFPHKLEQQVTILNAQPKAGMVYGSTQTWYSWTGKPEDGQRDFVHALGIPPDTLIQPPQLLFSFFFRQEYAIPSTSNIIVRRELLEEIGGYGDDFQANLYEDQAFHAKVCLKAPVFATYTCWDRHRQHPESSSAVAEKTGKAFEARLFFLNWLAGYLSEQGVQDIQIWQDLQKELWRCRHPNLYRLRHPNLYRLLRSGQHLMLVIGRRTLPLPTRRWLWTKWYGAGSP